MKTFTFTLVLLAAGAFTANIHAADDFTKGTNYHLIYLDEETTATIPPASIAKDYRPDDV